MNQHDDDDDDKTNERCYRKGGGQDQTSTFVVVALVWLLVDALKQQVLPRSLSTEIDDDDNSAVLLGRGTSDEKSIRPTETEGLY